MHRKVIGFTAAAGLLSGSVLGMTALAPMLTSAQTPPVPSPTAPATDHAAEHAARLSTALQPLVDNGTITATQRDAVVAQLQAAGGPGVGRGARHGERGGHLETAAAAIGIDVQALRTALMSGKSIATVATENGVNPSVVIAAIVAEKSAEIDQAVTDGKLTNEEGAARKARLEERVTAMVNGVRPAGGEGRHGRGGPGGPADID
jgi:hypothetical protein